MSRPHCDLSIVMPALDEAENVAELVPALHRLCDECGIAHDILVVTSSRDQATATAAAAHGAQAIFEDRPGYGAALRAGFAAAAGDYVLTMDADVSHRPEFVKALWSSRLHAEVTIASRYVSGGSADMSTSRYALSRVLNQFFRIGLDIPVNDLSSGFRLYLRSALQAARYTSSDFDILQEILLTSFAEGWRVQEVPFHYAPRARGRSHARVFRVGKACLRTFGRMWLLRNSILAADYDDRAHDSRIPLQRYWQRQRHRHVTSLIGEGRVLDVGCGSSRILAALPPDTVGVDVLRRKLRYARKFRRTVIQASGFALPFRSDSFSCVVCSQVIEHVPKNSPILDELCRVLAAGGRLVLGTPDYSKWQWVYIEKAYACIPGGYADEHISHYTYDELLAEFTRRGFTHEATRYILQGELIMAFRKSLAPAAQ